MPDAATIGDWTALGDQCEFVARLIEPALGVSNITIQNAGFCVECLLKAHVMRQERLRVWPSRKQRPALYSHDLRLLVVLAGIMLDADDELAPSWHIVLQWDRNQGYDPDPVSEMVLSSFTTAAFGREGVATWLRQKLT